MKKILWPEACPTLPRSNYVAWIISTYRIANYTCPSACAWMVHPLDNSEQPLVEMRTSFSAFSDEKRGNLAAAIGVIENLFPYSRVILFSKENYLRDGIQRAKRWRANGWRKTKNRPVENAELWQRLLDVIEKRHLSVTVLGWSSVEYPGIRGRLLKLARGGLSPWSRRKP